MNEAVLARAKKTNGAPTAPFRFYYADAVNCLLGYGEALTPWTETFTAATVYLVYAALAMNIVTAFCMFCVANGLYIPVQSGVYTRLYVAGSEIGEKGL